VYARTPTPWFASEMNWGIYALYYSFYLIINLIGVILGYLLNKTKFVQRLWPNKKQKTTSVSTV